MKKLLTILSLILSLVKGYTQSDPIVVNTFLSPPYSVRIADFGKPEATNLRAQLQLTDLSVSSVDVRLILTIKGNGITIRTNPSFRPRSRTTLLTGDVIELSGSQLAEYFSPDNLLFQGYSQQEFRRTGSIPEGFYEISFQAVEYNRGTALSNPNPPIRGLGWFIQHDPPWVVYPQQNDTLIAKTPQFITFQWQPRHIGTPGANFVTEYIFQLVEVWNNNGDINNAFLTTQPIYETTTQATNLAYTVAEPALVTGRKYAIRIQAREFDPGALPTINQEGSLFKNNGYSEVVAFTYVEDCQMPYGVNAEVKGSDLIKINWIPQFNHESVDVQYKVIGGFNTYGRENIKEETIYLDHFKPEQVVEYQVRGNCQNTSSKFSIPQTIVLPKNTIRFTPEEAAESNGCGEGASFKPFDPTTTEPLLDLKVGDVIKTTSENIEVTEVEAHRGDGWFIGRGLQNISPWKLTGFGKFNVQISKNYELLDGDFEIDGGFVAPLRQLGNVEEYLAQVNSIQSLVDESSIENIDLNKGKGDKGKGLPLLDAIGSLDNAIEATGEALTKLPEAAKELPEETIDVMEKLRQESKDLVKQAAAVAEESPEKAAQLVQQANEKMGEVVNTLSSLPGLQELQANLPDGMELDDISKLIKELLAEIEAENKSKQDSLQEVQTENNESVQKQLATVEAGNLEVADNNTTLTPLYDEPILVEDETAFNSDSRRTKSFEKLRKKKGLFKGLFKLGYFLQELSTTLNDPTKQERFVTGFLGKKNVDLLKILTDEPSLDKSKGEIKNLVVDYTDEELNPSEEEVNKAPYLNTAEVDNNEYASLPQGQMYYISPLVPLENRAEIEQQLETYLAEQEEPIFVNVAYSQDISTESYDERAKTGRPKGLSSNIKYISIHWVNIPGSVKQTIIIEGVELNDPLWKQIAKYLGIIDREELEKDIEETVDKYDWIVSNNDAWQRQTTGFHKAISPSEEYPKFDMGEQVKLLATVPGASRSGTVDVGKVEMKTDQSVKYITKSNITQIVLAEQAMYKVTKKVTASKIPYTEVEANEYKKDDQLVVYRECGDYLKVKEDITETVEGNWIHKDNLIKLYSEEELKAFDHFVAVDNASYRNDKSPYLPKKTYLAKGTRVKVLEPVKGKNSKNSTTEVDVAKVLVLSTGKVEYTTETNLEGIKVFEVEQNYEMKEKYTALQFPYSEEETDQEYAKSFAFKADAECGSYIRVKETGHVDAHWIPKSKAKGDFRCASGFCCTRCGKDLAMTNATFRALFPRVDDDIQEYVTAFNVALQEEGHQYNTCDRQAKIMAQITIETNGLKATTEGKNKEWKLVGKRELLDYFKRSKMAKVRWFKQDFWDKKEYIKFIHQSYFEKIPEDEEVDKSKRYKSNSDQDFYGMYNGAIQTNRHVKIPTNFVKDTTGEYKRLPAKSAARYKEIERNIYNYAYGDHLGNGSYLTTNDGYDYRGRGAIQITGKANYVALNNNLNKAPYNYLGDIVADPELVASDPTLVIYSAFIHFKKQLKGDITKLDRYTIDQVSNLINAGNINKEANDKPERATIYTNLTTGNGHYKCE